MQKAKLTIGKRLALGFGIVLILSVAIGVTGYWSSHSISESAIMEFHEIVRTDAALAQHAAAARADILAMRRLEKDILLNIDSRAKVSKYLAQWKRGAEDLSGNLNDIAKAAASAKDRDRLETMRIEMAKYVTGFNRVSDLIQDGKIQTPQAGDQAIAEFKGAADELERTARLFSAEGSNRMNDREDSINRLATRTKSVAMFLMLFSVILGTGICIFVTHSVTALLKNVIKGLSESAEQAAAASEQISSTSQQLAEGTSEQAAAIEQTSSSLEQMASMTKLNAEHAYQANVLMSETAGIVAEANKSMNQLTQSMADITAASEETSKIIKTIDEIAFQTNLLALNAAVEAARAGETGAGFAVVADEVRNLAMRAAEAAKNTATLIESTVHKIREGSEVVGKTGAEFSRVAGSASKMGELTGEISAASDEQAQGIEQINKAVSEIDRVIQQNAANAEESASASEDMSGQAERMRDLVREVAALVGGTHDNGSKKGSAVPNGKRKMPAGTVKSNLDVEPVIVKGGGNSHNANGKEPTRLGKWEHGPSHVLPLDEV